MIQLQINRKIEDELSALLGLSQSEPVFELKWKILPPQTLVFYINFTTTNPCFYINCKNK